MKKLLLLFSGLLLLIACQSKNTQSQESNLEQETAVIQANTIEDSSNWSGTYKGEFPCADCSGIKIALTLNQDKTYSLVEEYQTDKTDNSTFTTNGTFTFHANNPSLITLDEKGDSRVFFIGQNLVEMRNINTDKKIENPQNYTLIKVTDYGV
ncbi:MAG: copper resistance protein NlpE [Neisseriaceae bacterium]|nr:MAG: copper resistance protein NlpE [Neisseriaceae bacterium]